MAKSALANALYFIRLVFSELPADARILHRRNRLRIALAQAFPQWRFTAVEPATPMLEICRQKAEACGIASRCTFTKVI